VSLSQVGTELIRGISGGQKKRTSIGMELIISPGIIFLDEPTTGLDAGTAVSVIRLLKEYVEKCVLWYWPSPSQWTALILILTVWSQYI